MSNQSSRNNESSYYVEDIGDNYINNSLLRWDEAGHIVDNSQAFVDDSGKLTVPCIDTDTLNISGTINVDTLCVDTKVQTDLIEEKTLDQGVDLESVIFKDGNFTAGPGTSKIGDSTTDTDSMLHIQSKEDAIIWLEGDTDNVTEVDRPNLLMTQDGGALGAALQMGGVNSDNRFHVRLLDVSGAGNVDFDIDRTGIINNGTGNLPTFTTDSTLLRVDRENGNLTLFQPNAILSTPNVLTDNINEKTLDNGVNIDGVILKDNTINTNDISYTDYINKFETYSITGLLISANTETQLTNWTLNNGSLNGFNPTTGVWTCPQDAIYAFGLFTGITSNANITEVACHIRNNIGGVTRYLNVALTADLSFPWEGAVSHSSTNYFAAGETLNINVEFNNTETADFILRIIKLI